MPGRAADVLLISDDARLRAAVERHRASARVVRCLDAAECQAGVCPAAVQVWIDLDTPGVPVGSGDARRRVYFHSRARPSADELPPGLFIRKPVSPAVLTLLWAAVEADVSGAAASSSLAALPAWLLDYLELDLRGLCDKLVTRLPGRLGYRDASLYLYDARHRLLTLSQATHGRSIDLAVPFDVESGSLMAAVAHVGRVLCTEEVGAEWASRGLEPAARGYSDTACLIAPLHCDGDLVGVLNLSGRRPDAPAAGAVPLEPVFAFLGRVLHHARVHEHVLTEARVDCLTGLYNKRWMIEALQREIQRAERYATSLSLLLLDLDGLKAVNDQRGHAAGDCLLQHVAGRITGVLRQFDGAARVGGDEFVILLPSTRIEGARQVAQRLLELLRHENALFRDLPLPISASVGIAEWTPGQRAEQLIEAADWAMYRAKQCGRNQVVAAPDAAERIQPRPDPKEVAALIEEARRADQERARKRVQPERGACADRAGDAPARRAERTRARSTRRELPRPR